MPFSQYTEDNMEDDVNRQEAFEAMTDDVCTLLGSPCTFIPNYAVALTIIHATETVDSEVYSIIICSQKGP